MQARITWGFLGLTPNLPHQVWGWGETQKSALCVSAPGDICEPLWRVTALTLPSTPISRFPRLSVRPLIFPEMVFCYPCSTSLLSASQTAHPAVLWNFLEFVGSQCPPLGEALLCSRGKESRGKEEGETGDPVGEADSTLAR